MNDEEVSTLNERVKKGDVWWQDGEGLFHKVSHVLLNWVEFKDDLELAEPAAILHRCAPVALYTTTLSAFVTLTVTPCFPDKLPRSPS
jgi:hypothetical protein